MTIARKLWLGFGVLILIFLLASLTILLSEGTIRRGLTEIEQVEEPTRAAAYEMEINTVEIGRDVRVYLLNGDPRYREEFADDRAQFEEFRARYDELADTGKGRELGDRIDTLYGEYVSLGETLMDKKDEQGTVSAGDQEEFLRRQNALESYLDEEVLSWTNQQLAQAEEDANAAIRNVYMIIVGLILAGLLASALSATLINRGIVGGIRKLQEGADRIGRGALDHRIDLETSDELGTVADAFNDMLDRRREANAALRESEERLRGLSDATFEGIAISENGRVLETNRAFAELFGYERNEVIGMNVLDFVAPGSHELVRQRISSLSREPYEVVGLRKDGGQLEIEVRGKTSSYRDRIVRVTAVRDITERKEAERRLREAEERYRTLVENVPAVVYMDRLDEVSSALYTSPQAEEMFGYPVDEWLADPEFFVKLLHPEDKEAVLAEHLRTDATGEKFEMEYRLIARDGRVVWVRDESVIVQDEDESLRQGILLDITERKEAERRLQEAEARYRAVMEQSVEPIYLYDAQTKRVLESNAAFREMMGYTEEELLDMEIYDFIAHERENIDAHIQRSLEKGRRRVGERRYRHKDGSIVIVDTSTSVLTYRGKTALCAVSRDVTELRRAEEALHKSEASLAEAQRIAHLGNWEWDVVAGEVHWSDEVFRIYGYQPREFVPTLDRLIEVVHPEDRERFRENLDDALYQGEPYDFEHRIIRSDGKVRVVHRQAEVVRGEEGEPLKMVGTVHDITERKRAEEEIKEANRHLEELAVLKADFTAMVAHELDTPLAVIRGYADMLATGELDLDEHSRALDRVQAETDLLEALVSDVRSAAAVEREDFAIEPQQVAVGGLLRDAAAFVQTIPGDHRLITEGAADGWVLADPYRIGQVLRNLLSNAAKYSPNGVPIELRTAPGAAPGRVRIEVADQGAGIHPDDAVRIFEKFGRGRDGGGRKVAGTGLGLYLSRRILQAHGSELTLDSVPGGGSVFGFELRAGR